MRISVIFFISLCLFSHSAQSQTTEFWGAFESWNNEDLGSIFKIDSSTNQGTIEQTFDKTSETTPGKLIKAADGYLYGLREDYQEVAVIYRIDPKTDESEEVFSFRPTGNYWRILAGLAEIRPGELWGSIANSGLNGKGIIFKYDYINNTYTKLYDLSHAGIDYPDGELFAASNGKIYGLARGIQMNWPYDGAIYEIDTLLDTLTTTFRFSRMLYHGSSPGGNLIESNGKLYGICKSFGGGPSIIAAGVLFEYNLSSNLYTKRYVFQTSGTLGDQPNPYLFEASNGKLYGSTSRGGPSGHGCLFEFTPSGSLVKKLDLDTSNANLILSHEDANGRILGMHKRDFIDYSGVLSYDISTNSLNSLLTYPHFFSGYVYKAGANKYYAGNRFIFSYDSLFNNERFITAANINKNGGNLDAPLVLGPDQKLYSYHNRDGVEFYRFDPVKGRMETIVRTFLQDSILNVNGKMLLHPNGKFYVAFSYRPNLSNPPPGSYTRSGLLELDPTTDSLRIAYLFRNNMSDISGLALDSLANFYGFSMEGDSRFGRSKYLFKLHANLDSVEIKHTFSSGFYPSFQHTHPIISGNVLLALYSTSATASRIFKYYIAEDSVRSKGLGSIAGRSYGPFVEGSNLHFYGTIWDQVIDYDLVNDQVSSLINFGTNPSLFGSIPRALAFYDDILYGFNRNGPNNIDGTAVFSYDFTKSTNNLSLVHEFDSIDGRLLFSPSGPGLLKMQLCRPAEKPILSANVDTVCSSVNVSIRIDSVNLRNSAFWTIYQDSIQSASLQQSPSGVFNVNVNRTTEFFLRGEGGCPQETGEYSRIVIHFDSSFKYQSVNSERVCSGQDFIRPNGDTIFNITVPFADTTTLISSLKGCDSIIITNVQVDALNLSVSRGGGLQGSNQFIAPPNMISYQWIDCSTNLAVQFANSRIFIANSSTPYKVVISDGQCTDTTNCIQALGIGIPITPKLFEGDTFTFVQPLNPSPMLRFANSGEAALFNLKVHPNPSDGLVFIDGLDQSFDYQIFNIQGKLMKSGRLASGKNQLELPEAEGLYFVSFRDSNGHETTFKLVKQ